MSSAEPSSPDPVPPWPTHAERTSDPAVVRWVCHHEGLARSPDGRRVPDARSELRALLDAGVVASVTVVHGNLEVRVGDPDSWPSVAGDIHHAVSSDLARSAAWLLTPVEPCAAVPTAAPPTIADLQQAVTEAAGLVLAAHGGHLEVVELRGSTLVLRAEAACHGCRYSDDTVRQLVVPVLRRSHPAIEQVVLQS